ncbi:MAG: PAS domain S-box protein [Terracidiphilus sp.]
MLDTFLDALLAMLDLDFLYARARLDSQEAAIDAFGTAPHYGTSHSREEIRHALNQWSGEDPRLWPEHQFRHPGEPEVSVFPIRMGIEGELGLIVAGSQRACFPEQTESLVLGVAANQLAIGLQQALRLNEQKRVASELDRRVAERTSELAETNRELQLQVGLLQHLPVSAWTLKPDGTPDFVNQVWLEFSGQTFDHVRSHPEAWMTAVHPEDRERASMAFWEGVSSGRRFAVETRSLRAQDGTYRWHLQQAVALHDADGKVLKFVGATTDIDDQKRAEEALRASEANLRRVIDTIPSLSWCNLPDGPNEFLSKGWHDYTGLSPEEAHGWGWAAAFHPDDLPPLMQRWQQLLVSGESGEIEARIRRHDGEYRWFLIRVAPFRDDTGAILRWYGTSTDIHDRKLMDEALRASETNLRQIVNSIPGLICTMSPAGEIEQLNEPLLEYFGKTPEELKGWKMTDAVHPDDLPDVIKSYTHSVTTGTPYAIEHRCRRADGVYRWFQVRASAVRDADGHITGWYVLLTDIEDLKRAEDALRASETSLRKVLDSIPALVCTLSPAGVAELVNQQVMEYFGITVAELNAWSSNGAVHPEDLPSVIAEFTHAMTTGAPFDSEIRYRRADGVYRWFHGRIVPSLDAEGRIARWYALITDIDDRKRAEDELKRSEARHRVVVETASDAVVSIDESGAIILANPATKRIFGYNPEELIGKPLTVLMPGALRKLHEAGLKRYLETGARHLNWQGTEVSALRANGEEFPAEVSFGEMITNHRKVFTGFIRDISEKKRAEQALRASENNFRQIVNNIPGLVTTLSPRGEIELVNQQFLDYFGKSRDEVNSWRANDVLHPDDLHRVEVAFTHAMTTGTALVAEFRYRRADGVYRWFHARVFPVQEQDGGIARWYALATDIDDWKQAQEELRNTQAELARITRVMTIGQLTASIAHEVNQPLSGIITNASTCIRMLKVDPPNIAGALETAQRTIRDGKRAADVVTRLRTLFSKKQIDLEPLDLNDAVREVIALLSGELDRKNVVLKLNFSDRLPAVNGDRVQLQQVILNLLRNGSDAMDTVNDRPRQLLIRTETDGNLVTVSVQDCGVGFSQEIGERLFESFFTTKQEGMGIGLSVSRSIVEAHHGRLWAVRNPGPGATFAFSIPHDVGSLPAQAE